MKAIIFDVDDVLIDAGVSRSKKYELILSKYNVDVEKYRKHFESNDYSGINWFIDKLKETDEIKKLIAQEYADGP
jgi:beta-phosphoglucomutase-like phosphatase (HAD superfamily)